MRGHNRSGGLLEPVGREQQTIRGYPELGRRRAQPALGQCRGDDVCRVRPRAKLIGQREHCVLVVRRKRGCERRHGGQLLRRHGRGTARIARKPRGSRCNLAYSSASSGAAAGRGSQSRSMRKPASSSSHVCSERRDPVPDVPAAAAHLLDDAGLEVAATVAQPVASRMQSRDNQRAGWTEDPAKLSQRVSPIVDVLESEGAQDGVHAGVAKPVQQVGEVVHAELPAGDPLACELDHARARVEAGHLGATRSAA